ncbi:MAG: hypothetical protein IKS48_05980 [Eubacterium sp.]|nr:hypothetical protein [Eubacterium sp.]
MQEKLKSISESNDEMLTYFKKLYSEHERQLQESKDKLFEINVKLDELSRTESVYSLNNDLRKNVFSPIHVKTPENEREEEIRKETKELTKLRESLEYSVNEETIYLKSIDKRIHKIVKAKNAINDLLLMYEEGRIKEIDIDDIPDKSDNEKTFLESETSEKRSTDVLIDNNVNLMRSNVDIMDFADLMDIDKDSDEGLTRLETLDDGIEQLKKTTTSRNRVRRRTIK